MFYPYYKSNTYVCFKIIWEPPDTSPSATPSSYLRGPRKIDLRLKHFLSVCKSVNKSLTGH